MLLQSRLRPRCWTNLHGRRSCAAGAPAAAEPVRAVPEPVPPELERLPPLPPVPLTVPASAPPSRRRDRWRRHQEHARRWHPDARRWRRRNRQSASRPPHPKPRPCPEALFSRESSLQAVLPVWMRHRRTRQSSPITISRGSVRKILSNFARTLAATEVRGISLENSHGPSSTKCRPLIVRRYPGRI